MKRGDPLRVLAGEIVACRACPRLVAHRENIGAGKRRSYRDQDYWAKPVPGFGDPRARLVLVGLAPGAHGANRTGRMFTGDRSGEFLYAALHRAGFASSPESVSRDDGLELEGVFITAPVRCVPPDNLPTPSEIATCARWFDAELGLLTEARAFLALGAIAWTALHVRLGTKAPRFAHGAESRPLEGSPPIVASYHVSQQNTQTGRLTTSMFDAVLDRAWSLATSDSKRSRKTASRTIGR